MELRETYYEVYLNGGLEFQGTYEVCRNIALHAFDDDLAEVYEVTVTEEKVSI